MGCMYITAKMVFLDEQSITPSERRCMGSAGFGYQSSSTLRFLEKSLCIRFTSTNLDEHRFLVASLRQPLYKPDVMNSMLLNETHYTLFNFIE